MSYNRDSPWTLYFLRMWCSENLIYIDVDDVKLPRVILLRCLAVFGMTRGGEFVRLITVFSPDFSISKTLTPNQAGSIIMRYRRLGKTGLSLSEVGFGGIPMLRGNVEILPPYYNLTVEEAIAVMSIAYENGINFYDTAVVPEYGDSEKKVGKFQKLRPDIIIASKARAFTGQDMKKAVENSLRNLASDNCDIYFVHQTAPENQKLVFHEGGSLDVLVDAKKRGLIKHTGISTHHYNVALRAAKDERVDVIQTCGNVLERGMLDRIEKEDAFNDVGIVICKVYAGGVLPAFFSISDLVDFPLSYPKISSAVVGMGKEEEVAAAVLREKETPERMSIDDVMKKLNESYAFIPCIRCQKCDCSHGIEIDSAFRYHNYMGLGHTNWAINRLAEQRQAHKNACNDCEQMICKGTCGMGIDIPAKIEEILSGCSAFNQ